MPDHSSSTERIGISAVALEISRKKQIFRETTNTDVGIDGHIEFVSDEGEATGELCGVQVKSGQSYFRSSDDQNFYFTPEVRHQSYWENYPLPVLLMLHEPDSEETYFADARQQLRSLQWAGRISIPRTNLLRNASSNSLFQTVRPDADSFTASIPELAQRMAATTTNNAGFYMSQLQLFCLGMTDLCHKLYFGMDIALFLAESHLTATSSEFGVGLGGEEYDFLDRYVRLLFSQNLIRDTYSESLAVTEDRQMVPMILSGLSMRGRLLHKYVNASEDYLRGKSEIEDSRYRASQEAFLEMNTYSIGDRYPKAFYVCQEIGRGRHDLITGALEMLGIEPA